MAIELTQAEADRLIGLEKRRVSDDSWAFPVPGGSVSIPVVAETREQFLVDLNRGRIKLSKMTYQERYVTIPLVRLDIDGPDHPNPDGQIISCPHLHVYREGYGDRWAVPVPADIFTDLGNLSLTLSQFFSYCNVVDPPIVAMGIF